MKEIAIILMLISLGIAPVFSATWQVQEAKQFYTNGQYKQALQSINRAIEDNSTTDKSGAYKLRAKIYLKLNSPKSALADINSAIELTPKDRDLYIEKKNIYYQIKDYENVLAAILDIPNAKDISEMNYFFKELTNVINNREFPLEIRCEANVILLINLGNITSYSNELRKQYNKNSYATMCKLYQLILLLDDNGLYFKNLYGKPKTKEELLNMVESNLTYSKNLYDELLFGLILYAKGEKERGKNFVNGVYEEALRTKPHEAAEIKKIIDLSLKAMNGDLPLLIIERRM